MPAARSKAQRGRKTSRSIPQSRPRKQEPNWDLWICLGLAAAVFVIYARVVHFDFITLDDPDYTSANPHVLAGLTAGGIAWAFTTSFAGNWFPLTWISLMLDHEIFGLNAGGYHFMNVVLHVASTLLLFVTLERMTGARSRSALVAFLFALHPLRVESVAWVSERKDALSGLFFVLTLWAYARYAARPGRGRYALAFVLFCLGLMSKSMLVTLPILLLLLDRWPLRRGIKIVEKLPFFAASVAVSVVTLFVHQKAGAVASFELVPMAARLENALVSYVVYLGKMLWPVNLALFYPYPQHSLVGGAVAAGIAICAISVLVIRVFPRRPYLAVGWFWYLVTLLPVIGLIQAGAQARADRYTYIPMIGIAIAAVWGVSEALARWPTIRVATVATVCIVCLALTWVQVGYWRDSASAYEHAIAVTTNNYVARYNLAAVLEGQGDSADAVEQLRETVRIRPAFASAHAELGQLLAKQGQSAEALQELQTAVRMKPESAEARLRLGSVLGSLGRNDEAAIEFSEAARLEPENADAHYNSGLALAQTGRLVDAVREFRATVRLRPEDAEARFNLGIALAQLGKTDEAGAQFSEAVRINPGFSEARQALDELKSVKSSGKR